MITSNTAYNRAKKNGGKPKLTDLKLLSSTVKKVETEINKAVDKGKFETYVKITGVNNDTVVGVSTELRLKGFRSCLVIKDDTYDLFVTWNNL